MFHNLLERTNNLLVLSSFVTLAYMLQSRAHYIMFTDKGNNTLHHVYRQGDGNVEVEITISIT